MDKLLQYINLYAMPTNIKYIINSKLKKNYDVKYTLLFTLLIDWTKKILIITPAVV